jgi:hypothetical protein
MQKINNIDKVTHIIITAYLDQNALTLTLSNHEYKKFLFYIHDLRSTKLSRTL